MAFEIFRLFGSIMIDNEKANESISKTEEKAEGVAKKLGDGIVTAGKWGIAIGAGAAAAGGALFGVASKAADTTDRIDKMSQKIGMSKQGFQEWDYILGQNGISIDGLQGGMKTLTNMTDDLAKGGKNATDAFGRLGISHDDLKGKTQEDIFNMTIKALQGVEDTTERAAIANDLLGRSGSELAPLLNAGADSVDNLRDRAHDLGLVLSDDAVSAGVLFADTMDDLKQSFGNVVAQIGVELMPMFQNLMDWVIDHMPEIQKVMKKVFETIADVVKVVWNIFQDYLLPILKGVFDFVKNNWPTFQTIFEGVFGAIKLVWENVLSPVLSLLWEIIEGIVTFVSDNFPKVQTVISGVWDAVTKVTKPIVTLFQEVRDAFSSALDTWNKWIGRKPDTQPAAPTGNYGGIAADVRQYVNGSHANGLAYVPHDNYVAELHKGERVLTAEENTKFTNNKNTTVNLNIGTLIGDESSLKNLERKLRDIRIGENERLGVSAI